MVWKFLSGFTKKNNLQATLDRYRFRNLPFAYNWDNLVRSYDLRMYYIQNSHNNTKKYQYTQELERIHNELNYLSIKDLLKRQVIFLLLVTTFLLMVEKGNDDWQDPWEPKHENRLYNELEEGNDEGEDD